jgi:hypothetical protein
VSSPNEIPAAALNSIPAESVKNVEVGALAADSLESAVTRDYNTKVWQKAGLLASGTKDESALQLFKQADAAGKVDTAVQGTKFVDGDSLTLYVLYTLTRTKKFILDEDSTPDSSTTTPGFTPLGLSKAIADGELLESEPLHVLIAWQFVGRSSAVVAPSQLPA